MSISQTFEKIHDVSRRILAGANEYANAIRTKQGTESFSKWFPDVRAVLYSRPFFRTIEGNTNTIFALDIDVRIADKKAIEKYYTEDELREIKLQAVMKYFEVWLKENPDYTFLKYISGTGMYLVQLYNKPVPKEMFYSVVWNGKKGIIKPCSTKHKKPKLTCDGWHLYDNDLERRIMYDNIEIRLLVDMRMVNGLGSRLFRCPYSPYYKTRQIYHCVPIITDSTGNWQINETIHKSLLVTMEVDYYDIPEFQFEQLMETTGELTQSVRHRQITSKSYHYKMDIPEPDDKLTEGQILMINDMEKMVTGDVETTPPCIKRCFERSPDNPVNRHVARITLLRYLANKGNYSPSEVGTFIRFKINDDEDNKPQNRANLHKYIPYYYGNPENPDPVAHCRTMQNERSDFFACGKKEYSICRRNSSMASQRAIIHKITKVTKIKTNIKQKSTKEEDKQQVKSFEAMGRELRKLLKNSKTNYEIIKTTRAGVTTSLINECVKIGKKLLVISPTNAIGERTFTDAMGLIKDMYGRDTKGAVFSSNMKSCLKLQIQQRILKDKKKDNVGWGQDGIAYKDLAFHFKKTCISDKESCQYLTDIIELPYTDDVGIPLPIIESKITNFDGIKSKGLCSYQSVIQQLDELDVLFITYDKLRALAMSEDESTISELISYYDVVFMDEISQFAQKNSNAIALYRVTDEDDEWDIFESLNTELGLLERFIRHESGKKLIEIVQEFIDTYQPMLLEWEADNKFGERPFIEKFDNILGNSMQYYLHDNFSALYGVIEGLTISHNIHLKNIEKILLLMTSESWWIQNIPTYERKIDVTIVSAPIVQYVRGFVRQFDRYEKKQVIVTDATMPLIKMSELMKIDFDRFVVGDPRDTNNYQLVIADNKKVYPFRFFSGGKDKPIEDLVSTIRMICKTHGSKNVMVVLPNSRRIHWYIKDLRDKGILPKGFELTYYRSDKTIGVSAEQRVMLAVCSPYPPTGSYLWLASYYHEIGLYNDMSIIDLSKILEEMNAHQTFYQTIGRAKAPDNAVRSIVYAWGTDFKTLKTIIQMDTDVPIPHLTSLVYKNSKSNILGDITSLWTQYGIVADSTIIRIANYLNKRKNTSYTLNMLRRNMRLKPTELNYIKNANPTIFDHFGIYHYEKNNTVYLYVNE